MNVIVDTIQWTYSERADKTYPIKLRVMFKGESKYIPVVIDGRRLSLSKEGWSEVQFHKNVRGEKKRIKDVIRKLEAKALQTIDETTHHGKRPFSFQTFSDKFVSKEVNHWFFQAFDKYLDQLKKEGRIGTCVSYTNARQAFFRFTKRDIQPDKITVEYLKRFEHHLLSERKVSINTVAIYIRAIKVIYNTLASSNLYLREAYPFATRRSDKQKFQIRTAATKKGDALTLDQLRTFLKTDPIEGSPMWEAKQFWLFSFYCQGMNFKDIAALRKSDIDGDQISYVRSKTRHTELHQVKLLVPITQTIRSIIESLRSKKDVPFLFDILRENMSLTEIDAAARQKIKVTNKWLKRLCKLHNLPEITTYWARHTYASLLKFSGTSTDFIRELLGHSDIRTTESYLKRFDQIRVREVNSALEQLVMSE
jgi:integrase/recombinase XerD